MVWILFYWRVEIHSLCLALSYCTEKGGSHLVNTSLAKLQLRKWRKTCIQSQIKVQKCEWCFQPNNQGKTLQKHCLFPLMLQWTNLQMLTDVLHLRKLETPGCWGFHKSKVIIWVQSCVDKARSSHSKICFYREAQWIHSKGMHSYLQLSYNF